MFAIVEFMGPEDGESAHEMAIVPLMWVHKNDTRCYWPLKIKKGSFENFVKTQAPYKKSWPSYKIFKIHKKTTSYSLAESDLEAILTENEEKVTQGSDSSVKSLSVKKTDATDSDSSDSDSLSNSVGGTPPPKKRRANAATAPKQQLPPPKASAGSSRSDHIVRASSQSLSDSLEISKNVVAETYTVNWRASANQAGLGDLVLDNVEPLAAASTSSSTLTVHSIDFENMVVQNLAKLSETMEQHTMMLQSMMEHNRRVDSANILTPPENLPDYPMKTFEEFQILENLIVNDPILADYMRKRLSAVGGSGIPSLTRRIMRYLITNEVAVLFNWKGRDKLSFEKTHIMKIIFDAAKINFPANEHSDLEVANAIKDWLKYATTRLHKNKKP